MTCRHGKYDPACGSYQASLDNLKIDYRQQIEAKTPDSENFEIEKHAEVNGHLILLVRYPNCVSCSFEGSKVMVFADRTTGDALRWRKIDPHFREPPKASPMPQSAREAPSPAARFPATNTGWADAIAYVSRRGPKS